MGMFWETNLSGDSFKSKGVRPSHTRIPLSSENCSVHGPAEGIFAEAGILFSWSGGRVLPRWMRHFISSLCVHACSVQFSSLQFKFNSVFLYCLKGEAICHHDMLGITYYCKKTKTKTWYTQEKTICGFVGLWLQFYFVWKLC